MRVPVVEAMQRLEGRLIDRGRGWPPSVKWEPLVSRFRDDTSDKIITYVQALIGRPLPQDLIDFYREGVAAICDYAAIAPVWNDHVGWRTPDSLVTELLDVNAIPLFYDGCGSKFALDLTPGVETPAVYFFDHEHWPPRPAWCAGSSLGAFLLLAADDDRAFDEGWPAKWQLKIDPDIDMQPRARAIWNAG